LLPWRWSLDGEGNVMSEIEPAGRLPEHSALAVREA
jgi:hypothetical protein